MRVRMKTSMAGPSVRRLAGEELDVEDSEAVRLIDRGFAEPVKVEAKKAVAKRGKPAVAKPAKKATVKRGGKATARK